MQKHISDAEREAASAPRLRFVIVTLDNHLAASVARATEALALEPANVEISLHAASEFASNPDSLDRCIADIGRGDIILVTMLFMDDHVKYVLPALMARRDQCDAMICCMSAGEIIKLSRMGRLDMGKPERGLMALMKRLRGPNAQAMAG